jgi:hypothetical protein
MNNAANLQEQMDADAGRDAFRAEAICSAVNNTYGKRINPESVEKMKQLLEEIIEECNNGGGVNIPAYGFRYTEIKEALTASQL